MRANPVWSLKSAAAAAGVFFLVACQGTTGPGGSTGPAGPTGGAGPQGSQGAQGQPGAGIASLTSVEGSNTGIVQTAATGVDSCDGQVGMAFTGVTAQVTLFPNQVAKVSGTVDLGADATPVSNLTMNVCRQPVGGVLVSDINFLGDVTGKPNATPVVLPTPLKLAANSFIPFSMSRSFTACSDPRVVTDPGDCLPVTAAGTSYFLGLCGCILGTADTWVTNYSWLTVQVSKPQ